MIPTNEEKRGTPIYLIAIPLVFAVAAIAIGIKTTEKINSITFVKEIVFNNNTVYLYKVSVNGEEYYYLCPAKLPDGRQCIVSPTNLVCEFYTPCVRIYGIVKT